VSVLFALVAPMTDQICTTPTECADQGVDTFIGTPARIWASAAALVALAVVVVGSRALARSRRRIGEGRTAAVLVLVMGLVSAVNGAVVLAVADGGLGTGNGVAGGAVALVLGLVGAVLGGLVRARSRRSRRSTAHGLVPGA
jgi:hypothetical protein